jgi:hypothetical protein
MIIKRLATGIKNQDWFVVMVDFKEAIKAKLDNDRSK